MAKKPKVTVLMSVYNGETYLREAINSILEQTFNDFEFLIINDGSTDKTSEILESYNDFRIKIIVQENVGLSKSLNKGLSLAKGKYIARMDADDISYPERLKKQVDLLDREPDVGVCGTWVKTIDNNYVSIWNYPTEPDNIRCRMIFESVIAHPSAMIRRSFLKKYDLHYDENLKQAQDYELWVRCAGLFDLKNISEVLLMYRIHPDQVGRKSSEGQKEAANSVRKEQLENLGLKPDEHELNLHKRISGYERQGTKDYISNVNAWLNKLRMANNNQSVYPEPAFSAVLGERWFETCYYATALGMWTWKLFWDSSLGKSAKLTFKQKMLFAVKCGIKYDDAGRA